MSMVRTHFDLADDRDIVFLHSARTPDDIIFENELKRIAYSQKNFRTHFICEKNGGRRDWNGINGYLSLGLLQLRSEEHTSELQSLMRISYAVFCLKKKKQTSNYKIQH